MADPQDDTRREILGLAYHYTGGYWKPVGGNHEGVWPAFKRRSDSHWRVRYQGVLLLGENPESLLIRWWYTKNSLTSRQLLDQRVSWEGEVQVGRHPYRVYGRYLVSREAQEAYPFLIRYDDGTAWEASGFLDGFRFQDLTSSSRPSVQEACQAYWAKACQTAQDFYVGALPDLTTEITLGRLYDLQQSHIRNPILSSLEIARYWRSKCCQLTRQADAW